MTSCNGDTSNQSNQKVNYEKAMNQVLSEIFENLREIKQDTKRQRHKLLLERRRGSAPSSVSQKKQQQPYSYRKMNSVNQRLTCCGFCNVKKKKKPHE